MPEVSQTDRPESQDIILLDIIRQSIVHLKHGATRAVEVRLELAERILATGFLPK